MGKSKSKKYKIQQRNPTGLPSEKELEHCELFMPITCNTGTIETIIEKLQSRKAEDRECAAVIIANMAEDPAFVSSLLENKVIRVAAPLLVDQNMSVRHAVTGCLRNVAVCGDFAVSEEMVKQDIMTGLTALLLQYSEGWIPVESAENKIDSKSEIFLESCNLLWTLCENSDMAVSIFNKKGLLSILTPCLNFDIYGIHITLAVAQCLHTVSENNTTVTDALKHSSVQQQLQTIMNLTTCEADKILLKALAAGITLNMYASKFEDCMNDVTESILKVVSSTLSEHINPKLELLSQNIINHKTAKSNKHEDENNVEVKLSLINTNHDHLVHLLSAKQICLEMLGNMFEDGINEDWEDASSSESDITEMEVDGSMVNPSELGLAISSEILKNLISGNILQKITEQIIFPSDEMLEIFNEYPKARDCLKRLGALKCTALLCLNNLIPKLNIEDIGGSSSLLDLWLNIADLLFKKTDTSNTEQVEATTRCMSAVLKRLAEGNCSSKFSSMTPSDLELLINICHQSQDPSTQVHVIRCLGTIGSILGSIQSSESSNLIKIIGLFLLEICAKSSSMWVVAEALDVTFDVFGEDHIDTIAQEICLVEKLSHLLPILKGKVKQQRKSLGEHMPIIKTAQTNLIRFIKYKNDLNKK